MNAQGQHLVPKSLQPNLKATATAQSSQLSATANPTPDTSRSSSQVRPTKARQEAAKPDYVSRKATLTLIRRILAPDTSHGSEPRGSPRPVEDLLPPLTSSNAVDVQLYAIIAIVVKDLVNSWYTKITPDHVFVEEVVQIIAHCSRALEQRLRHIDLAGLILDEVPTLLEQHIQAYRISHGHAAASAYGSTPLQIYHGLNPHPALCPIPVDESALSEQLQNEATYRQILVQGALAVLLPTEDLENACLRTLVGDIIADLILGQAVAGKVCEGWFLHGAVAKIAGIAKNIIEPKATGEEFESDTRSRLEKFGLLSSQDDDENFNSSRHNQSRSSALFWRIMQYGYLAFLFMRFVVVGMSQARYLSPRSQQTRSSPGSAIVSTLLQISTPQPSGRLVADAASMQPVLTYRIFPAISTLLDLSTRMPWLESSVAFWQHFLIAGAGRLGTTDSMLDKFLYNAISVHILPSSLLPPLLLNLRATLFPNNTLGPPAPPPPTLAEQLTIRHNAAEEILGLVPPVVARAFFATSNKNVWMGDIEEMLDVFGDARMNKYLVYGIIELVVLRLVPEMGEKGWSEMIAERGVVVPGDAVIGRDDAMENSDVLEMGQSTLRNAIAKGRIQREQTLFPKVGS